MATDVPLNSTRGSYDPHSLPIRTSQQFLDALALLDVIKTSTRRKAMVTATGISDIPAVAFSLAFRPFEFFPLDPFHLFNSNVPKTIWKAFTHPLPGEFGLTPEQRSEFGAFIAANAKNYPVVFSSRAPRDISLYGNTSYKMVEWGSVFHHFLPAYLHSISAPADVRTMLDFFIQAVDLAMACDGIRLAQISRVRELFIAFVQLWERLYVGSDLALPRATISVHLLLHVFDQLLHIGTMRATSQAPCERALGSMKRGLTAFRFPYGVVARRARADTQLMLARLRLGLETDPMAKAVQEQLTIPISSSHRPLSLVQAQQEEDQLRALHGDEEFGSLALKRYGRYVRDGLITFGLHYR
ncbi:hypothetical protein OC842_007681 [Tilletia horrida]|uniref:Uncharacterized protein n=1 Tax=Tilletia horrida TaxID=155126 RepID=A0AAN6JGI2_9BASI|nr:hypothetical protein OC842_007681 [Tilletia horrida]